MKKEPTILKRHCGTWRRQTEEEKNKYKPHFDALRKQLEGWCFMTNSEWIEENNRWGKDRLILADRDDNGAYGVLISCDLTPELLTNK